MSIPHGYQVLPVILTATSNPYLADRLPLRGELVIHEARSDGTPVPGKVTFREQRADGTLRASVHVDDAAWETSPVEVGPRRVGGIYRGGYGGQTYRVTHVGVGADSRIPWSSWSVTEVDIDGPMPGRERIHCTPWDARTSVVVAEPATDPGVTPVALALASARQGHLADADLRAVAARVLHDVAAARQTEEGTQR